MWSQKQGSIPDIVFHLLIMEGLNHLRSEPGGGKDGNDDNQQGGEKNL